MFERSENYDIIILNAQECKMVVKKERSDSVAFWLKSKGYVPIKPVTSMWEMMTIGFIREELVPHLSTV